MEENILDELEALFKRAGRAHHRAFEETDGEDPEWPLWYANYLHQKLARLLGANFTKSELVYLLITAERERLIMSPGAGWASYYSRFFLDRYL